MESKNIVKDWNFAGHVVGYHEVYKHVLVFDYDIKFISGSDQAFFFYIC